MANHADSLMALAGSRRMLTCPRPIIAFCASLEAGAALNALLFRQSQKPGRWFYNSDAQMMADTCLSRHKWRDAAAALIKAGIVSSETRMAQGSPTRHYMINRQRLHELWEAWLADPTKSPVTGGSVPKYLLEYMREEQEALAAETAGQTIVEMGQWVSHTDSGSPRPTIHNSGDHSGERAEEGAKAPAAAKPRRKAPPKPAEPPAPEHKAVTVYRELHRGRYPSKKTRAGQDASDHEQIVAAVQETDAELAAWREAVEEYQADALEHGWHLPNTDAYIDRFARKMAAAEHERRQAERAQSSSRPAHGGLQTLSIGGVTIHRAVQQEGGAA